MIEFVTLSQEYQKNKFGLVIWRESIIRTKDDTG